MMAENFTQYRCEWCLPAPRLRQASKGSLSLIKYHDEEWGVPVHDDPTLFEFLILEGAQAGLTWQTVLNKRESYRKAFDNFDAKKIVKYGSMDVKRLLADPGIIRNRLKVAAAIGNAQAFLTVQKEFGSFDKYVWQFVGRKPINHKIKTMKDIPTTTKESDVMSKDLLKRGFKFVGSTICHAFMQAVGMINDHETKCFRKIQVCPVRSSRGGIKPRVR